MTDPLKPDARLLVKLGSIVVHADELLSADGHDFDRQALLAGLADADVQAWLEAMGRMALVPLKRSPAMTDTKAERAREGCYLRRIGVGRCGVAVCIHPRSCARAHFMDRLRTALGDRP